MRMENIKDIVIAIIMALVVLGIFLLVGSCFEDGRKMKLECLKLGKNSEECARIF